MAVRFTPFLRILTRERPVPALARFEARARALLTPSDWLIAGAFAFLMGAGAFSLIASISLAVSVEVPLRGGTHTEAAIGSPRFINPVLAISDTDQDLSALVFSGLMKAGGGGNLSVDLAERYEISEDGTIYTFFLSPEAEFHDGTPVTADDVVFTVKLVQNPAVKSPKRANWEGVLAEKRDERTVVFTLAGPYAPFLENTTLGIIPEHLWGTVLPEELAFSDLNVKPVGAGPYRVERVERDQSGVPTEVRLLASRRAITVPYVTRITFRFYPDFDAVRSALAAGAVHGAYGVIPANASTEVVHEAPYARIFGVFMNQSENPIFAHQSVRKALDAALDKTAMVRTMFGGYGAPLSGPLPPRSVERQEAPSLVSDLAEARAILEADGWVLATSTATSTGVSEPAFVLVKKTKTKTERLSFRLTTANAPELKQAAELIAEAWRALGAEVSLEFFNQGDLVTEVIRPRKYDALLFGEVTGSEPDLYAFWHSSQRNDPGLNIALYTNSTVDRLLERARGEVDPRKRDAMTEEAAGVIADERGAIFLYTPYFTYVTEPSLRGITVTQVTTPSDRFADVADWYLETERVWPLFSR